MRPGVLPGTLPTAVALVAAALAGTAAATAARADAIAALAPADDVRRAVVVGPSCQVWEPDGAGTWTRRAAGGCAADVHGAVLAGGSLVVVGRSVPLFRRDGGLWHALRLGERGRTVLGAGPRPSLAIGRLVFVWAGGTWKRVGRAPANVTALWAASDSQVLAVADGLLLHLAGGALTPVPGAPPPPVVRFGGDRPWAITADGGAYDVTARRVHRPTRGGEALTISAIASTADTAWALGTTAAGWALARFHKGTWSEEAAPPLAAGDAVVAIVVDRRGALLVATARGDLHLREPGQAWTAGTRALALPTGATGPGPARAP